MAAGRAHVVGRRRRADDEGEDDDGPVMVEDSQSEGSILSNIDDDDEEDVDASSFGGDAIAAGTTNDNSENGVRRAQVEAGAGGVDGAGKKTRKSRKKSAKKSSGKREAGDSVAEPSAFQTTADTDAMMNGLRTEQQNGPQDVVDYAAMDRKGSTATGRPVASPGPTTSNGTSDEAVKANNVRTPADASKSKRDVAPALSHRGNYFMHDTRTGYGSGNGTPRGAWSGRGRGRGSAAIGGTFPPANVADSAERAAEQQWKHDLHDTINEEPATNSAVRYTDSDRERDREASARLFPKPHGAQQQTRPLSFSSTTLVGKVSIRVFFPGVKEAIVFPDIPWKHYTRLPDHRPPLRRDKPVRVSIPEHPQRYIFPALERSFVFIPRQMRPNQQGFGRSSYSQRSIGGYGYNSRRTSMYGGSVYAGSVAPSRRSSFASIARDTAFSPPVGSYGGNHGVGRPVVRLPHGSQSQFSTSSTPKGQLSGPQTPTGFGVHTFPLPQQPIHQAFAPTTTMHQPRPQKAISMTGIESPAALQQSDAQPFQNQLPAHLHDSVAYGQQPGQYYSPRQQYGYPNQPQAGTPLSGIPEQAIQAPAFHPQMGYAATGYYAPYAPQPGYYYPGAYPPMPMFAPAPQPYMMSPAGPMLPQHPQSAVSLQPLAEQSDSVPQQQSQASQQTQQQSSQTSQSGMVAQEHNGMVFYIPAAEAPPTNPGENAYQPAESFVPAYAMPGLPPPTPAPDASYYYHPSPGPGTAYYSAQTGGGQ